MKEPPRRGDYVVTPMGRLGVVAALEINGGRCHIQYTGRYADLDSVDLDYHLLREASERELQHHGLG